MLLVLTAVPDRRSADVLAAQLVKRRLAACVSAVPGVRSVYRWKGKIERSGERLLLIKTTPGRYPKILEFLSRMHPYELPEIIALPVKKGSKPYLDWVSACVA